MYTFSSDTSDSMRDEAKCLSAISNALGELAEANSKLNSIHIAHGKLAAECQALLREKGDLESRIRDLESQKADFERYAMHELSPGVYVYALRESEANGDPPHYLCTRCRNEGKKSILQIDSSRLATSFTCNVCGTRHLTGELRPIRLGFVK